MGFICIVYCSLIAFVGLYSSYCPLPREPEVQPGREPAVTITTEKGVTVVEPKSTISMQMTFEAEIIPYSDLAMATEEYRWKELSTDLISSNDSSLFLISKKEHTILARFFGKDGNVTSIDSYNIQANQSDNKKSQRDKMEVLLINPGSKGQWIDASSHSKIPMNAINGGSSGVFAYICRIQKNNDTVVKMARIADDGICNRASNISETSRVKIEILVINKQ